MKTCPTCGRQYADTNTLCPADGTVLKRGAKDDTLIGQVLAGKYRIDEKIDEGGMGCVYRATHVLMEKVIAVKVLHPALAADDKIVARFTREAKAASRISHPHAISVTDFGEAENGVVYLVMEYLRGRTLKDIIREGGAMPLARVVEIVRQVAGALDAAHAEGVVHRDLKSDNIMLEEAADGGDWAKVLDFGIAKIQQDVDQTDPGLTAPNLIIGTPQYMSPEQCSQASDIDARSDIYSFGVIVYETLAGHVPFAGDSPTAIMLKHLQETPPSILDERKDLPAGVGRVIARALAKRPEDRYQKAGELADALADAAKENAAAALAGVAAAAASDTGRIIVPTSPNESPRTTLDDDEATVVSARGARTTADELPPPVAPLPEPSSFSPWRIAVPAIAALAIVFAVAFALQRRGASTSGQAAQPALKSDPNGQPVQPITPPTGQAERSIAPAASATPTPAAGAVITVPAGGAGNANAAPSPTPRRGKGNANQNEQPAVVSDNDNQNANDTEATPTPTPRRNKRLPDINANVEQPPPPTKKESHPAPRKVDEITKPEATPDKPPQLNDAPPDAETPGPSVRS
jgi:tRNA A-37 threonylcarbamoyl transferase component Bud32